MKESEEEVTDLWINAIIDSDDREQLWKIPLMVSMAHSDFDFALQICIRLATHCDSDVRANAIIGLGNIAKRFGKLPIESVRPIIEKALVDKDADIREVGIQTAEDCRNYLDWNIN